MGVSDTSDDLAIACDALADAIEKQRKTAGYSETSGEAATLDHFISQLQDAADSLRTAGVAASLESATAALADINNATSQAKAVVAKLKPANQMITMAGSVLSLAAAAASGNIGGIGTSVAAILSDANAL